MHIIYTDTKVLLSKKVYNSWYEIQLEYEGYKASLGSWSIQEVIEFLKDEYFNLKPSAEEQVNNFINASLLVEELKFFLGST